MENVLLMIYTSIHINERIFKAQKGISVIKKTLEYIAKKCASNNI